MTRQPTLQTLLYTPAQNTQAQNIQPGLNINSFLSNTISNSITSIKFSRPPLQIIPNTPLSFSLTSTNPNNTQHPSITHIQQITNLFSASLSSNILPNPRSRTSNFAYTTIRTDPHKNTTHTQPFTNPQNIFPNPSNTPTYNTKPPLRLQNVNSQFRLQHVITHLHPFLNISKPLMV